MKDEEKERAWKKGIKRERKTWIQMDWRKEGEKRREGRETEKQ